jgi:hypothetical protein
MKKDRSSVDNFGEVLIALEEMRSSGIIDKYAIGGAFAAVIHNEPLSTIDVDIFFFLSETDDSPILNLKTIYDFAGKKGFSFDHEFINIHGWLVQFVEASHSPMWTEAVEAAEMKKIGGIETPVVDKEHLVAMWLDAGRIKDHQKITIFWDADILDKQKLFDILERFGLQDKWEKEKWRFIDEE